LVPAISPPKIDVVATGECMLRESRESRERGDREEEACFDWVGGWAPFCYIDQSTPFRQQNRRKQLLPVRSTGGADKTSLIDQNADGIFVAVLGCQGQRRHSVPVSDVGVAKLGEQDDEGVVVTIFGGEV